MKFVTSNRHKFDEISRQLAKHSIPVQWVEKKYEEMQSDFTEAISFQSCAVLAQEISDNFFLEDTGLYIRALKGFPGPYSSYVKATVDLQGIIRLLKGSEDRTAYFKTVISLHTRGRIVQFGGVLRGRIASEPRGSGGFGYDPIFVAESAGDRTLAELTLDGKNALSHRGRAIELLARYIRENHLD